MNDRELLRRARHLLARGDAAAAEALLGERWPSAHGGSVDISAFVQRASARASDARRPPHIPRSAPPPEANYLLGLVRRSQNRNRDAARFLRLAVAAKADEPRYHFALGDALSWLEDAPNAADSFAAVLRLDPHFPEARRSFARAALAARRFSEAEDAARQLIAAGVDADAWDILSCALRDQGRFAEALQAAEEALRIEPNLVSARFNWAVAAARDGQPEAALAAFEALARSGVRAGILSLANAATLQQVGRVREAEGVLADAAAQSPTDVGVQVALAKARWQNGAGASFVDAFEAAISSRPEAGALRANCAQLLRLAGFHDRAEAHLREGLRQQPRSPALLFEFGALLGETGRLQEASECLRGAVEAAPGSEPLRVRWLLSLLQVGRGAEVLAELEPLQRATPFNQSWLAIESLARRLLKDPKYEWLCDYDLMVQQSDLPPPAGYADAAEFNDELADRLKRLHVTAEHPLDQTLRHGTQSHCNLLGVRDPVVRAYLDAVHEPIRRYLDRMRDPHHPWSGRKTEAFKLASAWSVRLRGGGYHVNHIHPEGWISSAYYVQLPPTSALKRCREGWLKLGEPPHPIEGLGVEKMVEPKVGRLVFFPSYFWHGTVPFAQGERVTAPFDVTPA